ncbi:hypothetical protein NFE57_05435, partial [Hephaestia sp. MAHUQ-44]|nr:hypothetical protein [Hephaestia sp. MAHUQ-44]
MGQVCHGSATTTHAVRAAIQRSQASLAALSRALGSNFHVDIAKVRIAEGRVYLFVGIDRTSKFAVTQLVDKADRQTAWAFLEHLLEAVPYRA